MFQNSALRKFKRGQLFKKFSTNESATYHLPIRRVFDLFETTNAINFRGPYNSNTLGNPWTKTILIVVYSSKHDAETWQSKHSRVGNTFTDDDGHPISYHLQHFTFSNFKS